VGGIAVLFAAAIVFVILRKRSTRTAASTVTTADTGVSKAEFGGAFKAELDGASKPIAEAEARERYPGMQGEELCRRN
jgi:hypothetical protein